MSYGIIKVDTIIFDQGGADQNVTVSGIYRAITSGVTVSGTISGAVLVGTTTVSGTTVTGTTANFVSGVFTTQISGATVIAPTGTFTSLTGTTTTGTTSSFTSGVFTTLSGATATFTSGIIASGTAAAPSLAILGDPNTGVYSPGADQLAVATNGTQRLTVDTAATTSTLPVVHPLGAVGTPSITFTGDLNTGIYSPAADTLALVTAGNNTLHITSGGLVGIGTSSPNYQLHVTTDFAVGASGFNQQLTFGNDTIQSLLLGTGYTALKLNPLGGNVGVGTASPGDKLDVLGIVRATNTTDSNFYSTFSNPDGLTRIRAYGGGSSICFDLGTSEKARIDSSGRLLVGTSTARGNFFNTTGQESLFEVESLGGPVGAFTLNNSSGAPGSLVIAKSRGATAGSNVIAQNNDGIGRLSFQASDGSEMVEAANIEAWVDGTPGANDMPGRLVFSTTADGASAPTERMRIDALGALKTSPNGTYKFSAGTTEITHNDATSSVQLIASSTGFTGDAVTISTYRNTVNDSYKFLSCIRQGFAVALEIRDDGDVYNVNGTYGSLSDVKLKENIVDANSQWDDIRQLRVRNYNFKLETNNSTHKQIGVIAQEIEDVSPGLVNTVPDRDEDGNDLGTVTKSVNYSVLYMKAVKALQEAMTRIETLEADVALLKSA